MKARTGFRLFLDKVQRILRRRSEAIVGRLRSLEPVLEAMASRPYELHFELTNLCNANCVFCPYQHQEREIQQMSPEVFDKAVGDFVGAGGGSVGLTPIVGDALIHPRFLDFVRRLRAEPKIDRIWLTTNAILLDKHGVESVLRSGLTSITISTSGFDEESYKRIYRSTAYQRMRRNVLDLVTTNARLRNPVAITIGLRTDRPLSVVMRDPDFQAILAHAPAIDFTWSFTSAGGRIKPETLLPGMKLRRVYRRKEACVQLYNGPIVLPDGTLMGCSCVAAMDAVADLGLGNVLEGDMAALWGGSKLDEIRRSFGTPRLNRTCAGCDMYRDLELYRTREGRERAAISRERAAGRIIRRESPRGAFAGG